MIELGLTRRNFFLYIWYGLWIFATITLFTFPSLWMVFGMVWYIFGTVFTMMFAHDIDSKIKLEEGLPYTYPILFVYDILKNKIKFKDR